MNGVCEFYWIGRTVVPDKWNNRHDACVNRLYYIHSGKGGYIQGGEKFEYEPRKLYLLPAFADIHTYSSMTDKIDHTYASYALIPPILTKNVLCIDPHEDRDIEAALNVFCVLAYRKLADYYETMKAYLGDTVAYLSRRIAEKNDCSVLKDVALIKALNIMHSQIGCNLSIADIASECGFSTDGFIRKFKANMGQTPYSYMKDIKT